MVALLFGNSLIANIISQIWILLSSSIPTFLNIGDSIYFKAQFLEDLPFQDTHIWSSTKKGDLPSLWKGRETWWMSTKCNTHILPNCLGATGETNRPKRGPFPRHRSEIGQIAGLWKNRIDFRCHWCHDFMSLGWISTMKLDLVCQYQCVPPRVPLSSSGEFLRMRLHPSRISFESEDMP
jgi:hypothetical protein